MDDLISRAEAIDAIIRHDSESYITINNLIDKNVARAIIEDLPSAQPKMGKWILDRSGAYCCSECMEPCATYVMMRPRDKFCKMCGSRNEVTE